MLMKLICSGKEQETYCDLVLLIYVFMLSVLVVLLISKILSFFLVVIAHEVILHKLVHC